MDIKAELIKLGETSPELRPHLTPVLDKIASERHVEAAVAASSLEGAIEGRLREIVQMMAGMIGKLPRATLRITKMGEEYGDHVFGVIKDKSQYLADVRMRYDGKVLHVMCDGIGEGRGFKLKLPGHLPAQAVAKAILAEVTAPFV